MPGRYTIVVAVEDVATATIVAAEGARVAMQQDAAARIVLLHVLDQHPVMGAVMGMGGYCAPLAETAEEGEHMLNAAEQALRAEFAACGRPAPEIVHDIAEEDIAPAIERVAREQQADLIVLGARRPHAFGRLVHPDVRAHVSTHAPCPIHVAALQELPAGMRV